MDKAALGMKISIVIPVYNVEKYVEETLRSVYSQGVEEKEFEVIIVNDGTPDRSMDKVQPFVDEHHNITVINQENKGLSGARNTGLKFATGEYVWFVDSDDKIADNGLATVLQTISGHPGHNLYGFGIYLVDEATGQKKYMPAVSKWYDGCPYDKTITFRSVGSNIFGPTARYIYRREWMNGEGLSFWEGILHEDMDFLPRAFAAAEGMWFTEGVAYEYLERSSGSIMSTIKMKSYTDLLRITQHFEQLRVEDEEKKKYFDSWMWRLVTIMLQTRIRQSGLGEQDRPRHDSFIKENKKFFKKIARRSIPVSIRNREWKDVAKALMFLF